MLVEFSIIPMGKGASVGSDIAKVIRIVENSGLPYKLNPMGTVVEGKWDELMALIKRCHRVVLRDGERVVTTIKIDDRKRRTNMIEGKIISLEKRLKKSLRT
ncbi:MAG: hypothetical protein AMK71_04995 [Nitrospira bacterium SG8_35_4]|nr:MAG: hypothetical protein AMK71_04995 [Nitrospira bacterium SG8_35_4]